MINKTKRIQQSSIDDMKKEIWNETHQVKTHYPHLSESSNYSEIREITLIDIINLQSLPRYARHQQKVSMTQQRANLLTGSLDSSGKSV